MTQIIFFKNKSDPRKIGKNLEQGNTMNGNLKNDCSIINPTIRIEGNIADFSKYNYIYIPQFSRYYFIRNLTSNSNDIFTIDCHVDVLESFKNEFLSKNVIIDKQEKSEHYSMYINDGSMKCFQNPFIQIKAFPYEFNTEEFILVVNGSE